MFEKGDATFVFIRSLWPLHGVQALDMQGCEGDQLGSYRNNPGRRGRCLGRSGKDGYGEKRLILDVFGR